MNYYVYIYLDPRKPGTYQYGDYRFDYEPFYVGKGSGNQFKNHILESKYNSKNGNQHKLNKIRKIQKENLEPTILKVEENISEQEAFDLEIWLIWAIGRRDLKLGLLTNLTYGGEGGSGLFHSHETKLKLKNIRLGKKASIETKKKMRESQQGCKNHFFGKHHTEVSKHLLREKNSKWKPTQEIKDKIREKNTGRKLSKETIQKIQVSRKGFTFTQESRNKTSNSLKGKKASQETKKKLSLLRMGELNSMFGKKHSEETKKKMSKIRKGIQYTEQTIKKMSESHKGKKHSEETKRKILESRKLYFQKRKGIINEESI